MPKCSKYCQYYVTDYKNDNLSSRNEKKKRKKNKKTCISSEYSVDDWYRKVKCGVPKIFLRWKTIHNIIYLAYILNVISIIYCAILLILALNTYETVGDLLSMVSDYNYTSPPIITCICSCMTLCLNILYIHVTRKSTSSRRNRNVNATHFCVIIAGLLVAVMLLVLPSMCITQVYSDLQLRNKCEIKNAMVFYNRDVNVKMRIDYMQITFQCCGCNTYAEWFDVPWFYTGNETNTSKESNRDDVPFSCCYRLSPLVCVHHAVMSLGTEYLYAPDTNLSLSERGCHSALLLYGVELAWRGFWALAGLAILLLATVLTQRVLQTAHQELYKYDRDTYLHIAWIIGCCKTRTRDNCPKTSCKSRERS